MQPDGLKENYNRKLDEIIEFFKTEKETRTFYSYVKKEDDKYRLKVLLSVIVILLSGLTILSNIIDILNKYIPIFIAVSLFFVGFYMIFDILSSKETNKNILHETIKYNVYINSIQSLKILSYEVNISKLINKLIIRYHLSPIFYPYEKYMEETWFKEIDDCFGEINNEILEKEKINGFSSSLP